MWVVISPCAPLARERFPAPPMCKGALMLLRVGTEAEGQSCKLTFQLNKMGKFSKQRRWRKGSARVNEKGKQSGQRNSAEDLDEENAKRSSQAGLHCALRLLAILGWGCERMRLPPFFTHLPRRSRVLRRLLTSCAAACEVFTLRIRSASACLPLSVLVLVLAISHFAAHS